MIVLNAIQSGSTNRRRWIESLLPYPDQAPQYIVLSALLFDPAMIAPFIRILHPSNWQSPLLQRLAQAALHDISAYGHVDSTHHFNRLKESGIQTHAAFNLTADTLDRVFGLATPEILAYAVSELTASTLRAAS